MLKFKNIMKKGMQFAFYTALVSGFSIFINKFGVEGLNPYLFTGFKNIEGDIKEYLPTILSKQKEEIVLELEKLIRAYDPCISCSTHFLKVKWE